jgi:uncharacterized membrane protein
MPALAVAYPVLAHLSVIWPRPWLQWLALAVLCALPLFGGLRARRPWAWGALAAALAVSLLVVRGGYGQWLLFLPPVAIPLSLLAVFAGSLRAGEVPLVTRFARLARGGLPADLEAYTRRVTLVWVVVLALLTASAVACALLASRETWSLVTNVLHYVVLGAVFAGEYLYRRIAYAHHDHEGFLRFLRSLASMRPRSP